LRVVLGANGAGKTTLMDLISGKTPSSEGQVFLYDTDITNREEHEIARAGVGRKFQIPSVFRELTVRRNLEVASCRNPKEWLELGLLIVQDPKVLLLDEPTAGMTQAETHKTSQIINGLKGRHTIVVVEHDMAFVREIAERITVMHLGQILAEGDVAAIERNPQVREAYLGSKGILLGGAPR
jgi:urea transport system ATP-binding protein